MTCVMAMANHTMKPVCLGISTMSNAPRISEGKNGTARRHQGESIVEEAWFWAPLEKLTLHWNYQSAVIHRAFTVGT